MNRAALEPTELLPAPAAGRVFELALRPPVGDVIGDGREGRARLDAIARWVQDVAYADFVDAGFEGRGAWVVRRTRLRVAAFPRFGEQLVLRTFCSGIGRFCAERRTTIAGPSAAVEAVALWVCLDASTWRPMRVDEDFVAAYGESAAGRKASFRLRHPDPPEGAERGEWRFRASDLDLAGHVNNTHYWDLLEERLAGAPEPAELDAEVEHRAPAQPGPAVLLSEGDALWVAGIDEMLHASILRW
jgi:acyl-ACP thioesterase